MQRKKARAAGLVAFAAATVGLTACGGTHQIRPLSSKNAPPVFSDLTHPHIFTPSEVKAAFAKGGLRLRVMPTHYGPHIIVLFDPRWHAPTDFYVDGGRQPPPTYIYVFVHANDSTSSFVQDGNVYVANSAGEERTVNAAFSALDRYKH